MVRNACIGIFSCDPFLAIKIISLSRLLVHIFIKPICTTQWRSRGDTYLYVSVDPPLVPLKHRITSLTRNGDLLGFIALVRGAEDKAADGGLVPCETGVGGDCGAIVVSDVVKDGGAGVILPCGGGAAGALRPCADGSIGGGGMLNGDEDAVAGPKRRKIRIIQTILCYRHF